MPFTLLLLQPAFWPRPGGMSICSAFILNFLIIAGTAIRGMVRQPTGLLLKDSGFVNITGRALIYCLQAWMSPILILFRAAPFPILPALSSILPPPLRARQ